MSTANEKMRKIDGGVIGNFNSKGTEYDVAILTGAVGDNATGITLPKGKVVVGYVVKNLDNDLAGTGATIQLKVGSTAIPSTALTLSGVKGKAVAKLDQAVEVTDNTEVKLTVGTAPLTAGKLQLAVIYV